VRTAGLEPLSVETVPVGDTRLGAPTPGAWDVREAAFVEVQHPVLIATVVQRPASDADS
jgi:hypothetical protein